jgi:hypothetical protein
MRAFIITAVVSATLALAAVLAWQAEAAAPAAPASFAAPYSPIHPAACYGGGGVCPPNRHRVCDRYGYNCVCAPC